MLFSLKALISDTSCCSLRCHTQQKPVLNSPHFPSARCPLRSKDITPYAALKTRTYASHVPRLALSGTWLTSLCGICLPRSPCIMFFIVPDFQQLDLINPGKTQRAQGSLNNWSDWAWCLAASLPKLQGNHNKTESTMWPCLLACPCSRECMNFCLFFRKLFRKNR